MDGEADAFGQQELVEKSDDYSRAEKKAALKKSAEYDRVSDDMKVDKASEILGMELVQLASEFKGIKHNLMSNIKRVNLAQTNQKNDALFQSTESDSEGSESYQSIADLTKNAQEEIKISNDAEKKE